MKRVTIVIPVYNVEKYIEKCINSVVNQTYFNIEVILVNDGSTDNSGLICDEWAKKDNRIKVIHKSNGGLSSARNTGLDIATGYYILFVDSDDYIETTTIDTLIKKIDDNDLVIFNLKRVNKDGKCLEISNFKERKFNLASNQLKLQYYSKIYFQYLNGWEAWNRIYKREIIEKNKLRFYDNKVIFAEDLDFNFRYLFYCKHIRVVKDNLYNYLLRENSLMGELLIKNKIPNFNNLSKHLYDFLLEQNNEFFLDKFYLIHFGIFYNYIKYLNSSNLKLKKINTFYSEIDDIKFFDKYMFQCVKHVIFLIEFYGIKGYTIAICNCMKNQYLMRALLIMKKIMKRG